MTATPPLGEVLDAVAEWATTTFPRSDDRSRLAHLRNELEELKADPSSAEEMADLAMILAHHARMQGVDLARAVADKFAVVKARCWVAPDAEGVIEHVRD